MPIHHAPALNLKCFADFLEGTSHYVESKENVFSYCWTEGLTFCVGVALHDKKTGKIALYHSVSEHADMDYNSEMASKFNSFLKKAPDMNAVEIIAIYNPTHVYLDSLQRHIKII